MGSMIYLSLGEFEVDWGKNNVFRMHGALFQPGDITSVPYCYLGDDGEVLVERREGAARSLASIVGRLELMGFTIEGARREYESLVAVTGLDAPPIAFDVLADALRKLDIDGAAAAYHADYDFGQFFAREIFGRLDLSSEDILDRHPYFTLGEVMENLDPYVVLRLLAENDVNASREVIWAFADVVENGWVDRHEIVNALGAKRRFLIVTEGSSDAKIIRHALELLRPDIADFFSFVDMEEGYPFTGTGNLHRFSQGLVSIGIENRVVVVYDNDTEGRARFTESSQLRLPPNMHVMHLPDHESLRAFRTTGPQGEAVADISGRAAAIECYLDLPWQSDRLPMIRWTSYDKALDSYQGELIGKQEYAKRFLDLRERVPGYDFSKIESAVDAVISECVAIAVADRIQ